MFNEDKIQRAITEINELIVYLNCKTKDEIETQLTEIVELLAKDTDIEY